MILYGKGIREAQFAVWYSVVSLQEVSSEVCKGVWPSPQPRITQESKLFIFPGQKNSLYGQA